MSLKHNIIINRSASFRKNAIAAALLGVTALLLSGCLSLFDSPQGTQSVHEEAVLQNMNKLASPPTPEDAMNKATGLAKDKAEGATGKARQHVADTMGKKNRTGASELVDEQKEEAPVGREVPRLSFERFNADMPHLAVWGLESATMRVDDKQIELGKMTRDGRIALISTGPHKLQIKCPFDPPFSAEFSVAKNDRVVVRGRCSSDGRAVAGDGKRN
jgi:hypothetical protein